MNLRSSIIVFGVTLIVVVAVTSAFGQGGTGRVTPETKKPTITHPIRPPKPNPQAPPFNNKNFLDALSVLNQCASQSALIREVRRRGVDFDLTAEVESELRAMGAEPELLAAVDDNFRSEAIRGGTLTAKAIKLVQPPYPAIAKSAHASGTVQVQIVIDEDGNVIDAQAISGHPLLYGASVGAARASKFTPTKLNGQPVKVTGVISYNFTLD